MSVGFKYGLAAGFAWFVAVALGLLGNERWPSDFWIPATALVASLVALGVLFLAILRIEDGS